MKEQQHERVASTPPSIDLHWPQPGIATVILGGEHDLASSDRVSAVLTDTLEVCDHLVVDLSTTKFIDSTTIRVLLSTKGRADATDRRFNLLLGTEPIVERALEVTGVLAALNRVHTLGEAIGESRASRPRSPTAREPADRGAV
jgi:anti-anti-sigma factor